MEVENCDNAADGNESEDKTGSNEKGHMDEDEDGQSVTSVSDQMEAGSASTPVEPELTLVLVGDTSSVITGPNNIVVDHDEPTGDQFSSRLYDLCGRRISVINMLGWNQVPFNEGIHAFVLLVTNGGHAEGYRSGLKWLEQTFGKESLPHVLTVVTHESDENGEAAVTELKTSSSFSENRFHSCSRSLTEGQQVIELVEKIDSMVSEKHPDVYSRKMFDEHEGQKQQLEPGDENLTGNTDGSSITSDPSTEKSEPVKDQGSTSPTVSTEPEPEATQVLLGVTASTETGPENMVLDHNQQTNVAQNQQVEPEDELVEPSAIQQNLTGSSAVEEDKMEESNKEVQPSFSHRAYHALMDKGQTPRTVSSVTTEGVGTCHPAMAEIHESGWLNESEPRARAMTDHVEKCPEEPSGTISNETNTNKQRQEETETIFNRLHLQDKLQHKMSPADFLKLSSSVKQNHEILEKDLAHTFLQRLMMLDYRARYIPVKQLCPVDTDESDCYSVIQTRVHPMDVQMSVFHCSDSFLQQDMVTKLSQCQYAVPLLVPHPLTNDVQFPLWTFRQMVKTWRTNEKTGEKTDKKTGSETSLKTDEKTSQIKDSVTSKTLPIYRAQTSMVSFLRLGSLSVSKSELMNHVINKRHDTFFHRNCAGSTRHRLLMDGVAEIAWYCPAGKDTDAFTDCVAFCNLHGDALEFEAQRQILVDKASVNVVLVPRLDKGSRVISDLLKSEKPLICLVEDRCDAIKVKQGKYDVGLKDKNQSDVSEILKKILGQILSGPHESFQLETLAKVPGIKVDENDLVYQERKSDALKTVHLFQKMDVSQIKARFFPRQGELWHKWCRTNKELYFLKGNIEKQKCKKHKELKRIRQEQSRVSCSEAMTLFIKSLSSRPPTDREFFLRWTQIFIDSLSTDDLTSILQDYDKTWSELLALKKKHNKSDQLKSKLTELEQISKKLQSATFGLEHIFREMGQIYEAHESLNHGPESGPTHWSKYPELAAELLISGHAMELMDGDAGHVPLTWVSSVLDAVGRKLGDRRVFVLSVLGVQSSGKSTMLNAMFGLRFAVSAGRCTRGAFMQLVKVSEDMKLSFDYVLVVDTEGLRALELEGTNTLHHDNELATFVVGLGNMTLINIFGENPAEMQDVLQIVVQAFMRMKKVKLSPSCVFVHQNVTDVTATEKNMDGRRRLQEKLDQMVKLAAKEEVFDAETFSDIIAFDVETDVKYFAQLWEGSPPMAPPNPGYSESVQELKDVIISKASSSAGVTLSEFRGRIQDLWNALLRENFVFSFRNTLEISVYRKLEVQYGNWTWTLRSNMLTIENQLHTRIENGKLDKVESSYIYNEMSKTFEDIKTDMTKYFDEDKDKEMLGQWQNQFEIKIKECLEQLVREVKRKLNEVLCQKKACKKLDEQKTEFETKLLQKSKELAQSLKDQNKGEEEIEDEFDFVWSIWVSELTADIKPIEDINLKEDQFNIPCDLGIEWKLINESRTSGMYKYIYESGDYSGYISNTKGQEQNQTGCDTSQQTEHKKQNTLERSWRQVCECVPRVLKHVEHFFKNVQHNRTRKSTTLPYEEQHSIRSLIKKVEQESMKLIKSKPVATRGYSSTYLQEMTKAVKDQVTEFQSQREYALKKEFTVDLLLFVFDRAERWISESQEKFKNNNDAATFVNNKKSQYYNIFRKYYKGSSSAVVLGELVCDNLEASIVEAVCNQTAMDLASDMRCNYPAFNGNRLNLERHVLASLAETEEFDGFITYIRHPRKHVESFIKEEVKKYITDHEGKLLEILKKNVDDVKKLVSQALFTATDKVKNEEGNIETWLKEFTSSLKDNMTFDSFSSQSFSDINDFGFLKEEIEKKLLSITEDTRTMSLDKINASRQKPDQILIDQLCSCCWVQCPFCAAVCTNTLEGHSPDKHNVPFHRPSGIEGWHVRGTVDLVVDFCTTLVASDRSFYPRHDSEETVPFKQYHNGGEKYASWMITADESKLIYWKWFVCRFQEQLEEYYNLKFQNRGEIPSEWRQFTKQEAIESLDEMCNE